MEIETVTIFKSWVEIASILNDADRGKLYHAVCYWGLRLFGGSAWEENRERMEKHAEV